MRNALHRERRDQYRQRDLRAEDARLRRDRLDVDEHARAELAALERGDVVAERDLVPRAAREVGVRARIELLLGEALVVPDVDRLHPGETNPRKTKPASDSRRRVSNAGV